MRERTKKEIISWIKSIIIAFIIAFVCRELILSPSTVFGESMSPTFQDKDRIIFSKISNIERFDVIIFHAPDSNEVYIKRVIGLPGDKVEVNDNILYINGEAHEESYLEVDNGTNLTADFTLGEVTGESTVPKNSYFVLGDNRQYSKDSRMIGFIPSETVIGEVQFRLFSFPSF